MGGTPICESLEPRQFLATSGLNAIYFNNRNWTGATSSRLDATVAFDWPNHAKPAPRIAGTTFAVRWHGLVKPPTSETYTFVTRNNDGVRLWVNGKLIIDSWHTSVRATHTGSIALTANKLYDLRLEYFDGTRTAAISLFWKTPTRGQEIIPKSRLFAYDTRSANIGDYGTGNANVAEVAAMMRSWKPQFITTAGDNNYPSGSASTIDANIGRFFFDFIGNYKGSYGTGPGTNLFFPTLGNHDWDTSNASPYLNYFTLPGNERYYDFVRGSIHFFMIDSDAHEPDGRTANSKQGQWLKGKLASSTSPFNLVIFHHPPRSGGSEGYTDEMDWPFKQWGADAVISGHNHDYERLFFNNMTYIVNGAGSIPSGFDEDNVPGTQVRNNSDAGALLIQANDLALTMQYQLRSGQVVDTVTIGVS